VAGILTGQLRLLPIEFQVLLDGHGRDYESFKASTWQDWSSSIKREYEKLEALGYTKISIVGSSTGGTLLLELVSSGYFNSHLHPTNLFLVDAIVVLPLNCSRLLV
jgi:carboxylesterase